MLAPNVSIVIPSWNGRALLEQHLPSVLAAAEHYRRETGAATEIIVVEDGGNDGSVEWLHHTYGSQMIGLRRSEQGGFAEACNTGFEHASGSVILLLNNDVSIDTHALVHLTPHFEDPQLFAVTCRAFEANSEVVSSGGRIGEFKRGFWRVYANYDLIEDRRRPEAEYPSILASGGFSAFDLEKVRRLGGFNSLLSPFYWEDVDLSLRAWHRGWKILYEPQAEVRHAASSTIGAYYTHGRIRRISQRNRLIVHWIHIHEAGRVTKHVLSLCGLMLVSLFKFDSAVLLGFLDAVRPWSEVRRMRREERAARVLSDRVLESMFRRLRHQSEIKVFNSREEYLEQTLSESGGEG